MKKIYTVIVTLVFSLQALVASAGNNTVADNNSENSSSTFYINAPRFVRPLIEKWIQEYKKEVPGVNFAIAKTQAAKNSSVLSIQLSDESNHKDASQKTAFFGSYAILPFTTKSSEAAKALENQQLGTKKLKALFFESEDLDEEDSKNNKFSQITIIQEIARSQFPRSLLPSMARKHPTSVASASWVMTFSSTQPLPRTHKASASMPLPTSMTSPPER